MSDKGGSAARQRERNRELASYMKRHHIERLTSRCPMCHAREIRIGGKALLEHLPFCPGGRRKASF